MGEIWEGYSIHDDNGAVQEWKRAQMDRVTAH